MKRTSNEWITAIWFFASFIILLGFVTTFWILLPEENGYQSIPTTPAPIHKDALAIQLEKAEISKVTESGREWEIHTDDLRKYEDKVYLSGVWGLIYKEDQPLYQLEAKNGQVDLENSDALLNDVRLVKPDDNGFISGAFLSWLGQNHFLQMEKVLIQRKNLSIESQFLRYDVKQGILTFRENVVITLKDEGSI